MAKNITKTFLDVSNFANGENATDGTFKDPNGVIQQAYGFIVKTEGNYEVMDKQGVWTEITITENILPFYCSGVRNVGDTTVSTIAEGNLLACWG